jgi:hypothetical protein
MVSDFVEAAILSPAVHEQLLADSCARTFVVCNGKVNSGAFSSLSRRVLGNQSVIRQLRQKSLVFLRRLLFSTTLEHSFFGLWLSGSLFSDEMTVTLEALLAGTSPTISP